MQKKKPALEEIIGSSSEEGIIKECLRESELVHVGQTKVRVGYFIINQSYECETSFSLYITEITFLKLFCHIPKDNCSCSSYLLLYLKKTSKFGGLKQKY